MKLPGRSRICGSRPAHCSGAALAFVLVIMIAGAALTAGWLAVMSAQTGYVDQFSAGVKRRIAFNNGHALAQEYLLAQVLTKTGAAAVTATVTDSGGVDWGSVDIAATAFTPLTTTSKFAGYNFFNPGNGDGYAVSLTATITSREGSDVTRQQIRRYFARSRSPLLGGDVFIAALPPVAMSVSGTTYAAGRSLVWAGGTYSLQTASFTVPPVPPSLGLLTLPNGSGQNQPGSNFAFPPLTSGDVGGVPAFNGALDVVANSSGLNSLAVAATTYGARPIPGASVPGVTDDGAGLITIEIGDPAFPGVVITGTSDRIVINGQISDDDYAAAGNLGAVSIVVVQDALMNITFNHRNARRAVLAIKKSTPADVTCDFPNPGSGGWRLLVTLENVPTVWTPAGSLVLTGGIQTNSALSVTTGSLTITPELDPRLLDRLTARDTWVESYNQ